MDLGHPTLCFKIKEYTSAFFVVAFTALAIVGLLDELVFG